MTPILFECIGKVSYAFSTTLIGSIFLSTGRNIMCGRNYETNEGGRQSRTYPNLSLLLFF